MRGQHRNGGFGGVPGIGARSSDLLTLDRHDSLSACVVYGILCLMRRTLAALILALLLVCTSSSVVAAKSKKSPLQSCIAALDAAEKVGVRADLYVVNARRCRSGINTAEVATVKEAGAYTPVPSDFQLEVIVIEQECFGSAGCIVTYRIQVAYAGAQAPDPKQTFTVSYDLLGGEEPEIGSFSVRGTSVSVSSSETVSTPPNPTVTAIPKQVIKG